GTSGRPTTHHHRLVSTRGSATKPWFRFKVALSLRFRAWPILGPFKDRRERSAGRAHPFRISYHKWIETETTLAGSVIPRSQYLWRRRRAGIFAIHQLEIRRKFTSSLGRTFPSRRRGRHDKPLRIRACPSKSDIEASTITFNEFEVRRWI